MKKILLFLILYLGLVPVLDKQGISLTGTSSVYASYGQEEGDDDGWDDDDYYDDEDCWDYDCDLVFELPEVVITPEPEPEPDPDPIDYGCSYCGGGGYPGEYDDDDDDGYNYEDDWWNNQPPYDPPSEPNNPPVTNLPNLYPNVYGNIDYYTFRYNDFISRNPGKTPPDYYLNYGDKYIRRFTYETYDTLSDPGKQWFTEVRENLQVEIDKRLREQDGITLENDSNAFKEFAFGTHADVYWEAGLYNLETLDLVKIFLTPDVRDLISPEGINQVQTILGKFGDYYIDNPNVLGTRIIEASESLPEIYILIEDKIIREINQATEDYTDQFNDFLNPIKNLFEF